MIDAVAIAQRGKLRSHHPDGMVRPETGGVRQKTSGVHETVVSQCGKELNLETSKCKRTLSRNGLLTQIVELDGSRDGFTNEQLEAWIERFPIEGPQ